MNTITNEEMVEYLEKFKKEMEELKEVVAEYQKKFGKLDELVQIHDKVLEQVLN